MRKLDYGFKDQEEIDMEIRKDLRNMLCTSTTFQECLEILEDSHSDFGIKRDAAAKMFLFSKTDSDYLAIEGCDCASPVIKELCSCKRLEIDARGR